MKKLVARIISEVLYYLGDWISYPMHWFDWYWLYPTYNNLMCLSGEIQDWAGNNKPWKINEKN